MKFSERFTDIILFCYKTGISHLGKPLPSLLQFGCVTPFFHGKFVKRLCL